MSVSSIETNNEKRNNHLKFPDFLNTENFPKRHFIFIDFQKISDTEYEVKGKLRIKDVIKKRYYPVKNYQKDGTPHEEGNNFNGIGL